MKDYLGGSADLYLLMLLASPAMPCQHPPVTLIRSNAPAVASHFAGPLRVGRLGL